MRRWPHSGFGLDFQRKIEADDRKGLEGLLAYMDRPPISLQRLTYLPDGLVHYQGTRVHPRLGTDHQLLPAVEFLALLAGPVLLRYQVTKRSYGALSTTFRKRVGWIEAPPVHEAPLEALAPFSPSTAASDGRGGTAPRPETMPGVESETESELARSRRRRYACAIYHGVLVLARTA